MLISISSPTCISLYMTYCPPSSSVADDCEVESVEDGGENNAVWCNNSLLLLCRFNCNICNFNSSYMMKNPPQLAADPTRAGVKPLYRPRYPSYLITPLTVVQIDLEVAAEFFGFVLLPADLRRLFSSTCMRTLIKSSGYKRIVEDAPPAIPARKDDIGSNDL